MAFFDDLGKKLSQASQTTIQKTKGLADSAKLSAVISEEEKVLKNYYCEIGKLYFSLHATDFEMEFADLIQCAQISQQKIDGYHQQINDLRGYTQCKKCGENIPTNTSFCGKCGTPVPGHIAPTTEYFASQSSTVSICSECGAILSGGLNFCTQCGSPIILSMEEPPVMHQDKIEHRCCNCGTIMEPDSIFCCECGTKQ